MNSRNYKNEIRNIIRNVLKKKAPGLKKDIAGEAAVEIARAVHARFYGSAVDEVASPIWRDDAKYQAEFSDAQPTKTAQELLNE